MGFKKEKYTNEPAFTQGQTYIFPLAVKEDIDPFEPIIIKVKKQGGITLDNEMNVDELKQLVEEFKAAIKEQTGLDFPTNPMDQLWGAICAVFDSWMNERAILYRKMEGIPAEKTKTGRGPMPPHKASLGSERVYQVLAWLASINPDLKK